MKQLTIRKWIGLSRQFNEYPQFLTQPFVSSLLFLKTHFLVELLLKNEMNEVLGHLCAYVGKTGQGEAPEDGEINEMKLLQDAKFEPWRSEAEHATSRLLRLSTILKPYERAGRKYFVSLKLDGQSGARTRDLRFSSKITHPETASFSQKCRPYKQSYTSNFIP